VNRCLAEGRERLRAFLARAETGQRCREMAPLLSTFCDGELDVKEAEAVREHLRACAGCRATLRSYRAAPGAAAVLAPPLLASRSLFERAQDALAWLQSKLPGGGGNGGSSLASAAASGAPAAGVGAVAKAVAICAGAGGVAACVAAGVAPVPLGLTTDDEQPARIERSVTTSDAAVAEKFPQSAQEPSREATRRRPARRSRQSRPAAAVTAPEEAPAPAPPAAAEPPPPPEAEPPAEPVAAPAPQPTPEPMEAAGSPAGEFGP
jgi:hypothetical protein